MLNSNPNLLGSYKNGNYQVTIYDNGTKIRENDLDHFEASFPECMDVKITDYCDLNCPYCHENSSTRGKHGDILSPSFLNTLHPFTEIAIGGGNPLSHPHLVEFLEYLKNKNIIANITVNQNHFIKSQKLIRDLVDKKLVRGIGVSLSSNSVTPELISLLCEYENLVIHVINGVVSIDQLQKLYGKGLKLLILGYKNFRKGIDFYELGLNNIENKKLDLSINLMKVLLGFDVVSFDNLAINQLNVKDYMPSEKWNEFYMGDDGQFTMYMDLVEHKFARCSISDKRHELLNNLDDMFKVVKNEPY